VDDPLWVIMETIKKYGVDRLNPSFSG